MSYVDFAEIKDKVSIEQGMNVLNLEMKKSGNQFRGACPVCERGGDRSLVITPSKNAYYCFAQRKGGDVIALVSHIEGIGMKEAAEMLAGNSNSSRNSTSARKSTVPEERTEKREAVRKLQPLQYLQPDHEAVQALGVLSDTAEHFGAGYSPKGIMRTRLALPIHTWDGELVAYTGRAVNDESPTLIFPNGFRPEQYLFNAHRIEPGEELYLTRDPLEVLKCYENGIGNVVSILTDQLQSEQLVLLASFMDSKEIEHVEII